MAFALAFIVSPVAFAAQPDGLLCDVQPAQIHATWDSSNPSLTEVTVQLTHKYADNTVEPVRISGIKVLCQSSNTDVLSNAQGGSIVTGETDPYGRVTLPFQSPGNAYTNIGSAVITCTALQQASCSKTVSVYARLPSRFGVSTCPTNYENKGNIIADGSSKVKVYAQLLDASSHPVRKSGIQVTFQANTTNYLKVCGTTSTGSVTEPTDANGVAVAEFCSAGDGTQNAGTTKITVSSTDYPMTSNYTDVVTTKNSSTTYINGQIVLTFNPSTILSDSVSTTQACVQLRKYDGTLLQNPPLKPISLISENPSYLLPVNGNIDPSNPGYTEIDGKDSSFPQGDIYTTLFKSRGPGQVSPETATVQASAEFYSSDSSDVTLYNDQLWPADIQITESPDQILCDGESTTTITAQLVDAANHPIFMAGRDVTFTLTDTRSLETLDKKATVTSQTNAFGIATATFKVKDCKEDNAVPGNVSFTVSSISPSVSQSAYVTVILPKGYKPDGINVYTDHTLEHRNSAHDLSAVPASHASPSLISADGHKPVYVTAQVCQWEQRYNASDEAYWFCDPVKRSGIRVEFHVLNDSIVMNREANGQTIGVNGDTEDTVYAYTNNEGIATAVFNSSGTSKSNEGCTNISVTGLNSDILGTAYSRVCAKQEEVTSPNAAWVWAQPAFITADGSSKTTLRAALYYCDSMPTTSVEQNSSGKTNAAGAQWTPDNLSSHCTPVQLQGATVKFDSMSPQVLENTLGNYETITTTNKFGQASAVFKSTGYDHQNVGKSEIKVYVTNNANPSNIVSQLNKLYVTTEEKTWPWSPVSGLSGGAAEADANGDGYITDGELLTYLMNLLQASQFTAHLQQVMEAINAWSTQ